MIPAHDEGTVIERCLRALTADSHPGEIEIIVVCNGCIDDTAERARAFGNDVRVIETDIESKSHALNLGDEAATSFPRFYVDADVVFRAPALRRVSQVLDEGHVFAAEPRLEVDLTDRGWAMRAYHAIWMRLPYVTGGMLGSGVYAVSQRGRERFQRFPDIIADDEFIRRCFDVAEKASILDASFTVIPPVTLASLINIEVRRRHGMKELMNILPENDRREYWSQRITIARLAATPTLWPALVVYLWVKLAPRFAYAWQSMHRRHTEWRRDDSSRVRELTERDAGR